MSGFFVFLLLILLTMAVAVGFHASGQGKSGPLWGTVVFCTGVIGLVFYAISLASD